MADWMNNEITTQRQIEEQEKERRRRESDKWSKKWNRMSSAASPKIALLKKVVSEFGAQTGYKSNVHESHEIDKAHWTKNDWITKWIYATAHYYIKNLGFEVSILVREPFCFLAQKFGLNFGTHEHIIAGFVLPQQNMD